MRFAKMLVMVLVLGLALALVGCGGGSGSGGSVSGTAPSGSSAGAGGASSTGAGAGSGGATVNEQNFAFNPATLTVKVGDTVTFTNNDSAPHNVKIDGQELGSQGQGESKTWKATKAGSYPFSCTIHPSMVGQITVQ